MHLNLINLFCDQPCKCLYLIDGINNAGPVFHVEAVQYYKQINIRNVTFANVVHMSDLPCSCCFYICLLQGLPGERGGPGIGGGKGNRVRSELL